MTWSYVWRVSWSDASIPSREVCAVTREGALLAAHSAERLLRLRRGRVVRPLYAVCLRAVGYRAEEAPFPPKDAVDNVPSPTKGGGA